MFVVAVRGPSGVHAEVVTSVNIVGNVSPVPIVLPTSYTDADPDLSDAGRTGWTTKIIDISSLGGSPITISFSVSDVGDEILSSIVFIDNIRFN